MDQQKLDRVLELAEMLKAARAEVARVEALIALELGDGGGQPAVDKPDLPEIVDRPRLIKARAGRQPSDVREKIVALAKKGKAPVEIAAELELEKHTVANHLFRARKAGDLPKARGRKS